MKIGIVTLFDNGNYGSELQAIAMNGYLQRLGHNVSFCKVKATHRVSRAFELLADRMSIKIRSFFNTELKEVAIARGINSSRQRSISPELRKHVGECTHEILSIRTISARDFNAGKDFDCYICGSDQIWSASALPIKGWKFLNKIPSSRKIAYAPSFGLNQWPSYFCRTVAPYLKDFQHISLRESVSCDKVEAMINRRPENVLDPTLLVGRSYWDRAIDGLKHDGEDYVLCYFLGAIPTEIITYCNKISYANVILPYKEDETLFTRGKYIVANPLEFVDLIKGARAVLTDSFHGSVFAALYNKPFAVVNRSHEKRLSQTSRIDSFLQITGLEERKLDDLTQVERIMNLPIDYNRVNEAIAKQRRVSETFLDKALERVAESI